MADDSGAPRYSEPTALFERPLVEPGELCWWCRTRPATTGEHKYKQTDLARLMGDGSLIWWGDEGTRQIRGKSGIKRDRHGVVKFPKSLCASCNNARSQPFDRAYDKFSEHLASDWVRIMPGVPFNEIYGDSWRQDALDLARYYGKHFGCRMVRTGLPVPESLRAFLDGAQDMPDAHMALVTTDSVHRRARNGLTMSADYVSTDPRLTRFRGYVMAAYVGSVGVRYQWWTDEHSPDSEGSQFFHFPMPVLNRFTDDEAVMLGTPRRPGWFARFSQWLNGPTDGANDERQPRGPATDAGGR